MNIDDILTDLRSIELHWSSLERDEFERIHKALDLEKVKGAAWLETFTRPHRVRAMVFRHCRDEVLKLIYRLEDRVLDGDPDLLDTDEEAEPRAH